MTTVMAGLAAVLRRRPLLGFIVLAFAGSWLCWLPSVLGQNGTGVLPYRLPLPLMIVLNQLALFAGPFLASLVMSKLTEGSLRPWLSRLVGWRVPPLAYVLALIGVPLVIVVVGLVTTPASQAPQLVGPAAFVAPVIMYVAYLVGGPLQEEPGWRGYALPRMQEIWSPVTTALVLGVIWAAWHLPQFLVAEWETPHRSLADVAAFGLFAVAASVVLSWVTNVGRGSVLLAMLAHNSLNWILSVWPLLTGRPVADLWSPALALSVLAIVGAVLTRGRLGLERGDAPARRSISLESNTVSNEDALNSDDHEV